MLFAGIRQRLLKSLTNTPPNYRLIVCSGVFVEGCEFLRMGDGVSFNQDCFISAYGGIEIGNEVSVGHRVSILSTEHRYDNPEVAIRWQPIVSAKVVIGNNVWIGANVTILAGTVIPDGCIIAAGAVVTKKLIEQDAVYAGCPAKLIKRRFNSEEKSTNNSTIQVNYDQKLQ